MDKNDMPIKFDADCPNDRMYLTDPKAPYVEMAIVDGKIVIIPSQPKPQASIYNLGFTKDS